MEYFDKLRQLLKIEREEELRLYEEQVLRTPLKERRKKGITWYPVKIKSLEVGTGDYLYADVARTAELNKNHVFQVGNPVSLFAEIPGRSKRPSVPGVVAKIDGNNMTINFTIEELPDWVEEHPLGIDVLFDQAAYKEMEIGLGRVESAEGTRLATLRDFFLSKNSVSFRELKETHFSEGLNDSQNKALNNILAAKDLAIVHGPPGTGKTTTLVASIKTVLLTERQVLVTAPSNNAVDLLVEKLTEQGVAVVRLGNPARVNELIMTSTLDYRISVHSQYKDLKRLRKEVDEFRKTALKFKRVYGFEEKEERREMLQAASDRKKQARHLEWFIIDDLLSRTQVIAATLVGCSGKFLSKRHFQTVFIDEAAQALEPACWIAIAKADRIVLAGDHCQLPPTVKSMEAEKGGLGTTLFEKLIADQEADVMLDTQYRMNEPIMNFSSRMFYNGNLIAHESVAKRFLTNDGNPVFKPVEFVDTAGCSYTEEMDEESQSRFNSEEAQLLLRYFRQLNDALLFEFPAEVVKKITFGIISPYQAQVRLLRDLFAMELSGQETTAHISINTIDGFQGQERDIVIISLVRSNEGGKIGFLRDTRRMNVAMTRARKKLAVIGDSATISSDKFYKSFLDYVDEVDGYKTAWELV